MSNTKEPIELLIEKLLIFGLNNRLINKHDVIYVRNQILDFLHVNEPYPYMLDTKVEDIPETATPILEKIIDYALENNLIPEDNLIYKDLFDTKLMGFLTPSPSAVIDEFQQLKINQGIKSSTDYFYNLCRKSDYIRTNRIAKNIGWKYKCSYGILEITINLTKPEKDPKEIAVLKNAPQSGYPKCLLCKENVGYSGRVNHPARQTLRTIPLTLNNELWHFQYSPYVYYNEHCIVISDNHVPMKISKDTFLRLFEFVEQFPHYFIGSNADLPIVGGSILNHDHFQGGYYRFPMETAKAEYHLTCTAYPSIFIQVVNWPMSVLRLSSSDYISLCNLSSIILDKWRDYSDPSIDILASTKDDNGDTVLHNTITPIARKNTDGLYEIDLVFRNNRTDNVHPLGIFHPHEELHHIKKENIGLIEVMGLFILPGRLHSELNDIKDYLTGRKNIMDNDISDEYHSLRKHSEWISSLIKTHGTNLDDTYASKILEEEIGLKCQQVLWDSGVFKANPEGRDGFNRFLETINIRKIK